MFKFSLSPALPQVEKLARLNSRYVAPAGAEKPEAAGKVRIVLILKFNFAFDAFS